MDAPRLVRMSASDPPAYAELHCLSNFSFQRGASTARELFERAKACGYDALAITDECSMAGIVRALEASRQTGVRLIVGTEVQLDDGPKLVLLAETKAGYVALCRMITRGRRAADKGVYRLMRADLADGLPGTLALWVPGREPDVEQGAWVRETFGNRAWLAIALVKEFNDGRRCAQLEALGRELGLPCVAAGDVHMHVRRRLALQHTMTAIRHRLTIAEAGAVLFRNGERHLRQRTALETLYPAHLLTETVHIADRCRFSLDELRYEYPAELVPAGYTAAQWLRELTESGVRWRWPAGEPAKVRQQIEHELGLIADLRYESYFLTVHDIVRFARSEGILCQGRGSAANSAVCFALGVTEVDPSRFNLLMERFISKERNEPPDIDIDFEHERREEVIQYIYRKYGRERAALAAAVICYRGKSAVRDVAKAMGLPLEQVDLLSKVFAWWDGSIPLDDLLRERGFDPASPVIRKVVVLTAELMDQPRHLSQHVGGFVIADAPLHELVPVENAAMEDRTILQWDKDDLDTMGLLKVDCLALGMLTCVQKCLNLLRRHEGHALTMATLPPEDPATYAMIQRADTLGVFQIESRAQMAMLPRHRPENFYDLVIQVAIVRPGPIQGDMIHPYLRRRRKEEPIDYPSEDLKVVFERTLGVPLFQEQVMKLAIVAAGYTAGEADQLRRAMAAWKRHGGMDHHRERIMKGMLERGYTTSFAEQLFEQIKGFGSYGFPESHAASFAGIVYASCWLKCHHPAMFACALLNSQPMGFYAPSQIVQDAQRHGIAVRPVDVRYSEWDCSLEPDARGGVGHPVGVSPGAWVCRRRGQDDRARTQAESLRRYPGPVCPGRPRQAPSRSLGRSQRTAGVGRPPPSSALGGRGRGTAIAFVRGESSGAGRRATAADPGRRHPGRLRAHGRQPGAASPPADSAQTARRPLGGQSDPARVSGWTVGEGSRHGEPAAAAADGVWSHLCHHGRRARDGECHRVEGHRRCAAAGTAGDAVVGSGRAMAGRG